MPVSFSPPANRDARARGVGVTAVLGPTNTGKTHLAIERMLAHSSGIIGLPLLLPALIGMARGLGPLLAVHGSASPPGRWVAILALYDVVFALLSYAVFDFLLED